MNDQGGVPLIVFAQGQAQVEAINSTLRNAGHPVHCSWIPDVGDLADALTQINPELLLCFVEVTGGVLDGIMDIRNRFAPEVPVVAVRDEVDESISAAAMRLGAQDVVSLQHKDRLTAVVARELRSFRLERALNATLNSAREYKQQLQAFMEGSADAIAHVQEGIIVDANPAWLELFGYPDDEALMGQPLMDLFEPDGHAAMKGALVACTQGKWNGHPLKSVGTLSDGSNLPLKLDLSKADFDGEDCVRVCIVPVKAEPVEPAERLSTAVNTDPSTGFYNRQHFLECMEQTLGESTKAGIRALAYIKPDNFANVNDEVGPLASEEVLAEFAGLLKEFMQPNDLYGRFGGTIFMVLAERGAERDVEAWGENIVRKVSEHLFEVADKSISVTCTVGAVVVDAQSQTADIQSLIEEAAEAAKFGRNEGGNQVYMNETEDTDTRIQAYDKIWVKHIKSALMDNRFRLVHQPIATLTGEGGSMYDVLVRMLDNQGSEVLPSEFMPAAERNDLMKNIDRWVMGAALSFCATRKPECIFVRLSKDSIIDSTLPAWLKGQLRNVKVEPQRICIQIAGVDAHQYLKQTRALAEYLRKVGLRFAVEHFGVSRDPMQILNHVEMDYLKIDGSLMQTISSNDETQRIVRGYVDAAKAKNIETIAERVEDANTMAVLWQLGIAYMQGYYVQEPEVVLGDQQQ